MRARSRRPKFRARSTRPHLSARRCGAQPWIPGRRSTASSLQQPHQIPKPLQIGQVEVVASSCTADCSTARAVAVCPVMARHRHVAAVEVEEARFVGVRSLRCLRAVGLAARVAFGACRAIGLLPALVRFRGRTCRCRPRPPSSSRRPACCTARSAARSAPAPRATCRFRRAHRTPLVLADLLHDRNASSASNRLGRSIQFDVSIPARTAAGRRSRRGAPCRRSCMSAAPGASSRARRARPAAPARARTWRRAAPTARPAPRATPSSARSRSAPARAGWSSARRRAFQSCTATVIAGRRSAAR